MAHTFVSANTQYWQLSGVPLAVSPVTIWARFFCTTAPATSDTVTLSAANGVGKVYLRVYNSLVIAADAWTDGGGFQRAFTANTWATNKWQTGTAVFEANGNKIAYVNGGGAVADPALSLPTNYSRLTLAAGTTTANAIENPFGGSFSDIAIWQATLSPKEIAMLEYTDPLLIRPSALRICLALDGNPIVNLAPMALGPFIPSASPPTIGTYANPLVFHRNSFRVLSPKSFYLLAGAPAPGGFGRLIGCERNHRVRAA